MDAATLWLPKADTLKAIPLSAIHDFLTRRGWVQKPSPRSTSSYYEHSTMRLDDGRVALEQPLSAHKAGTVRNLVANIGQSVSTGAVICNIEG